MSPPPLLRSNVSQGTCVKTQNNMAADRITTYTVNCFYKQAGIQNDLGGRGCLNITQLCVNAGSD